MNPISGILPSIANYSCRMGRIDVGADNVSQLGRWLNNLSGERMSESSRLPGQVMYNFRTSGAKAVGSPVGLRGDLVLGRRELSARFRSSPTRTLPARELLSSGARSEHLIYHLEAGWACQFRDLPDGRRAIFDITFTSIKIRAIHTEEAVNNLIGSRAVSLYMVWLLAQRQRRADHHLVALACHDGRARLTSPTGASAD